MPPWTNEAAASRNGFATASNDGETCGSPTKRRSEEPRGVLGSTGAWTANEAGKSSSVIK